MFSNLESEQPMQRTKRSLGSPEERLNFFSGSDTNLDFHAIAVLSCSLYHVLKAVDRLMNGENKVQIYKYCTLWVNLLLKKRNIF